MTTPIRRSRDPYTTPSPRSASPAQGRPEAILTSGRTLHMPGAPRQHVRDHVDGAELPQNASRTRAQTMAARRTIPLPPMTPTPPSQEPARTEGALLASPLEIHRTRAIASTRTSITHARLQAITALPSARPGGILRHGTGAGAGAPYALGTPPSPRILAQRLRVVHFHQSLQNTGPGPAPEPQAGPDVGRRPTRPEDGAHAEPGAAHTGRPTGAPAGATGRGTKRRRPGL